MATPNSSSVSLKLLIDPKQQKVLFAEAGEDFVDFLFTLLYLPVGTIIRLVSKDGMVGCFGKLYESIENLGDTSMKPAYLDKDILRKPKAPVDGPNILGLLNSVESPARDAFYMCSKNCSSTTVLRFHGSNPGISVEESSHRYVTENPNERCPECNNSMSSKATYVGQPKTKVATSHAVGSVKGSVTYMIMDDLEVKPMSISSITMLNGLGVTDLGALVKKDVDFGMDEGVKLLKESLQSKSVLTNVFLGNKASCCMNIPSSSLHIIKG